MAQRKIETPKLNLWTPKIGEQLSGKVDNISEGKYGTQYEVAGLVLPAHKQLAALLSAAELKIGDDILVKYVDTKKNENGTIRIYELYVND